MKKETAEIILVQALGVTKAREKTVGEYQMDEWEAGTTKFIFLRRDNWFVEHNEDLWDVSSMYLTIQMTAPTDLNFKLPFFIQQLKHIVMKCRFFGEES